jgi:hypothetical protein
MKNKTGMPLMEAGVSYNKLVRSLTDRVERLMSICRLTQQRNSLHWNQPGVEKLPQKVRSSILNAGDVPSQLSFSIYFPIVGEPFVFGRNPSADLLHRWAQTNSFICKRRHSGAVQGSPEASSRSPQCSRSGDQPYPRASGRGARSIGLC